MASQSGSDGPSSTKRTLSDGSNGGGKRTLADLFIGPPRDVRDPGIFHSLSLIAFLAWVGLGSDGLSSSCYGPEEAFKKVAGSRNVWKAKVVWTTSAGT